MSSLHEKITGFIKNNQLLIKHTTVLLGVSGGPDSMALLQYFYLIRDKWDLTLIVVSANHQLRGEEGQADLDYVKAECVKRDIKFIGTSLDVPAYKHTHNVGTQVAARELRYQFYAEQMEMQQADFLALGHHGDDQIETMLMALVRTADSSSFSGMPMKRSFHGGQLIRPMLCVTKSEIEEYCEQYSIIPKIDPSNNEPTYTRNYYRKYVLPHLKKKNQNLHMTIQHLSESLLEDENYIMKQAKRMFKTVVTYDSKDKQATLNIDDFKTYPTALQRRTYHLILNYLYEELPKDISYTHEDNFFRIIMGDGNAVIDFPAHLKIRKSYRELMFYFESQSLEKVDFDYTLEIPARYDLPDGSQVMTSFTNQTENEERYMMIIPEKDVVLPLHIRTRQPGDLMSWKGLNGNKKIKNIFIDEKIPAILRDTWPIVTDHHGSILWLVGLRKKQFNITQDTDSFIKIIFKK